MLTTGADDLPSGCGRCPNRFPASSIPARQFDPTAGFIFDAHCDHQGNMIGSSRIASEFPGDTNDQEKRHGH